MRFILFLLFFLLTLTLLFANTNFFLDFNVLNRKLFFSFRLSFFIAFNTLFTVFTVYTEDISRVVQIDQAIGFRRLGQKKKKKHLQEAANVEQKIIYIQILRENSMGDFSYFQIMRTVEVKQAKGHNVFCCCCAAAFANRLVRRSVVDILQSKREKERRQHACHS